VGVKREKGEGGQLQEKPLSLQGVSGEGIVCCSWVKTGRGSRGNGRKGRYHSRVLLPIRRGVEEGRNGVVWGEGKIANFFEGGGVGRKVQREKQEKDTCLN